MDDREKAVNALERVQSYIDNQQRTYASVFKGVNVQAFDDMLSGIQTALALLKAQEPRVMTLEELPEWDGAFLVESRRKGDMVWASWYAEYELYGETVTRMVDIDGAVNDRAKRMYGSEWRAWTSRPTDEQREATPWMT